MDNFNLGNPGNSNSDKPIPLDDLDKPIPLDEGDSGGKSVSHSPLDLGDSRPVELQKTPKPVQQPKPVSVTKTVTQAISGGRITGVRTFFTKLHTGALSFLDDQIMEWLKKNPNIIIKQINTCVGEVQGKKTEPNIVITVWY